MRLNLENTGISEKSLKEVSESLSGYVSYLKERSQEGRYDFPEASINLPGDGEIISEVNRVAEEKGCNSLKYVILAGIGGSNLGAKAVYDALSGHFDRLEPDRYPKIIFADTNDPRFSLKLYDFLSEKVASRDEVILNIISKSGETTETVFNAEMVFSALREKFGQIEDRVIVTSDRESALMRVAEEKGIETLSIPRSVGGRYSVLSSVGLFPLRLVGLNIKALLGGAVRMREKALLEGVENPSLLSASALFLGLKEGKRINDNFAFHPELESLGKWYRQLMGESVGKEKDLDGQTVNAGITPTVTIGSTDLHSMGQLYLGGPKDKMTTFIWSAGFSSEISVPEERIFPGLVPEIDGKSAGEVMAAIYEGTKTAYRKAGLPFMEFVLDNLDEESLGEFLQFKMAEMIYLGKLMNVNAFDEPNVESYKKETRRRLKD